MSLFTRFSLIGLIICCGFSCSSSYSDDLDLEKPDEKKIVYAFGMSVGEVSTLNPPSWGVAYPLCDVQRIKGDASVVFKEGDFIKIRALKLGKTDYLFKYDGGLEASVFILSTLELEMNQTDKTLRIDALNYMPASVKLNWGTKWEIKSYTSHVIEKPELNKPSLLPAWSPKDCCLYILTDEKAKGSDIITLKNEAGEVITVEVVVK